jgi:hypothetical protein
LPLYYKYSHWTIGKRNRSNTISCHLLPFIDLNIAKNIIKREGRCAEKALPSTPYSPNEWPASLLPKGTKG